MTFVSQESLRVGLSRQGEGLSSFRSLRESVGRQGEDPLYVVGGTRL